MGKGDIKPSSGTTPLLHVNMGDLEVVDPSTYTPEAPTYSHFSDVYTQRGMGAKMDRSGADAAAVVNDHANTVTWRRSAECPNRRLDPNTSPVHVSNCPFCHGTGDIYWESRKVNVAILGLDLAHQYNMYGEYRPGTVSIIFPPGHVPNIGDRVELQEDYMMHTEVVHMSSNPDHSGGNARFRLKHNPLRVERVLMVIDEKHWPLDSLPTTLDDGSDSRKALLKLNHEHVQLEGDNEISLKGTIPPGTAITVVYWFLPQYVVEVVTDLSRDAFDGFPIDRLQDIRQDQFERPDRGWTITAIAGFDFLMKRTDVSRDTSRHYANYKGDELRNTHNEPIGKF